MTALFLDSAHPALAEGLRELGFEIEEDFNSSAAEMSQKLASADLLVVRSRIPIDKQLLRYCAKLKVIARVGAGMENIDVQAAEENSIVLLNAPEGNRNAVAEQALGMLLMLFNNLARANSEVRQGIWKREENRGVELDGKTIGIIGYGNTGSRFARKLTGFEVEILAHDLYKQNFGNEQVQEASLEDIWERADVVSLHLPQNTETLYYVDAAFIQRMKKPFYLINTARGKLVRTSALLEAMEKGKVLGACLDVLEYEKSSFEQMFQGEMPKSFQRLLQSDQVILSPHIAGWTHESNRRMAEVLVEKVKNWKERHGI